MGTYIKHNVKHNYVEFENELDSNLYNIGETYQDYLDNKWVKLSSEQIEFKTNNPTASIEEVLNMVLKPKYVRTLESAKFDMSNIIIDYDSSDNVNIFYIQGLKVWLDKATRTGLKLRFEAESASGLTETILWYNNMQFPLSIENAIQMLYAIEIYASACYDNTQRHLSNVDKLTSIEEVDKYDYRAGYPEKLNF